MAPRFSRTAVARVARASPSRSTRSSIVSDFSFGKERRIRRRSDFLRVQAVGERATSRHFVLLVAAREDGPAALSGSARLGIVATRKVGDATMRNRIKRVCRECFRLWPSFVPDGIDLVVIARSGADTLPLAMVREEWQQARGALLKRCAKVLAAAGAARPEASSSGP